MPEDGMPEPAGFGVREIHRPGDRQQTAPSDDTDGRSDRAAGHRGGIATAAWKVARASVHDLSRDLGRRVADARVDVATQDEPNASNSRMSTRMPSEVDTYKAASDVRTTTHSGWAAVRLSSPTNFRLCLIRSPPLDLGSSPLSLISGTTICRVSRPEDNGPAV